jgi:hypothetical protein
MAMELLASIANALTQLFAPELSRQYNRTATTAKLLTFREGRGKNIAWDVEFSGAGAASYAEGSDVAQSEFLTDPVVPAILPWGRYRSAFALSGDEIDIAASSQYGAMELVDIVGERVIGCATKLITTINNDLILGEGSDAAKNPTIFGFLGGAIGNTGVYAGISRTTYPEWAGNVIGNSGTARPLTIDLMNHMDELIFNACGLPYGIIVTSPGVYRQYSGIFEPIRRIATDGRGPLQYDTVAAELFFKGIPIVRDRSFPAGKMMFLNLSEVEVLNLPQGRYPDVNSSDGVLSDSNGQTASATGVRFRIYPLAKTGDAVKFVLQAKLQLKVKRPNCCGIIEDIAEA